jgi:hypothetical protein
VTGALDVDDDGLELVDGLGRHHELVLPEARRAVGAVPLAEHVEWVVELRQVLHLAAVGTRLAVPQLADRAEGVFVGQSVREHIGQRKQLRRIEFQRVSLQFLGQLLEPRQ